MHYLPFLPAVDVLVSPEFSSVSVSEAVIDKDEWVVTVKWSEPVISCNGSVSQ